MSLRTAPRVPGDPLPGVGVRRSLVGAVVLAVVLAACGSSNAPTTAQPSPTPSVAPSSSAPPTAVPTPTASPTPPASAAAGAIVLAGMSSVLDKPAQTVDTSTFTTTFASETPAIYILYELTAGSAGKVQSTWTHAGAKVNTNTFSYPATAHWAYFVLTNKAGFIPGDDQIELKVVGTGDVVTLPFTITGPRTPPATPTPVPSGTSAFTLSRMATFADSSKGAPDPATYTDTFLSTASKIYVVFSLRSGLTGKVVCTMTANGSEIIKPITLTYSAGNAWGDFEIGSSREFPVGDYVATVTFSPSAEAVTIPFTVTP